MSSTAFKAGDKVRVVNYYPDEPGNLFHLQIGKVAYTDKYIRVAFDDIQGFPYSGLFSPEELEKYE